MTDDESSNPLLKALTLAPLTPEETDRLYRSPGSFRRAFEFIKDTCAEIEGPTKERVQKLIAKAEAEYEDRLFPKVLLTVFALGQEAQKAEEYEATEAAKERSKEAQVRPLQQQQQYRDMLKECARTMARELWQREECRNLTDLQMCDRVRDALIETLDRLQFRAMAKGEDFQSLQQIKDVVPRGGALYDGRIAYHGFLDWIKDLTPPQARRKRGRPAKK